MGNERLKMRDLERATGVGRETIRFYIREGLLPEPDRPSRNVAWYDESFVARIRLIKELQRTRYLPLQVIKAVLDSGIDPTEAEAAALGQLEGRLFATPPDVTAPPEPLAVIAARTGLPVDEIEKLAEIEAIEIVTAEGVRQVAAEDVEVVEAWAALRDGGFSEALDFQPDILRVHVGMVSLLVDEELRLFARRIAGRVDADEAARMAETGILAVARMLGAMRRARILRAIRELGFPRAKAHSAG